MVGWLRGDMVEEMGRIPIGILQRRENEGGAT